MLSMSRIAQSLQSSYLNVKRTYIRLFRKHSNKVSIPLRLVSPPRLFGHPPLPNFSNQISEPTIMTESDVAKTEPVSTGEIEDNEIRVTSQGRIRNYIAYATFLFCDKRHKTVVLKGMGRVINKTVSLAEILKRQVQGLHQLTEIGSVKVVDSGSQTEDAENLQNSTRRLSTIKIVLTTEPDAKLRYQPPVVADQEKKIEARNILKGRDPNQGQNVKMSVGIGGALPKPKTNETGVKEDEEIVVEEKKNITLREKP